MRPKHYKTQSGRDLIDFTVVWNLDAFLFTAMKYILRKDKKGTPKEDLVKCAEYLKRRPEIEHSTVFDLAFYVADLENLIEDYKLTETDEAIALHIGMAHASGGEFAKVNINNALKLIENYDN